MITAASTESAEMITLIVSNPYSSTGSTRITVTLAADATLLSLHEKVGSSTELVVGTFSLVKTGDGAKFRLDDAGVDTTRLFEAGLAHKSKLIIDGVDGSFPTAASAPTGGGSAAAQALGTVALWNASRGDQQPSTYGPLNRGGASAAPNADGFTGLLNQGATCYLSSVVQSLFMTPPFREALYALLAPTAETGPISRELQRIFVRLQTTDASAVETKALTRSFGWTAADAFEQHDVQEFLRVLFDALETELEGTPQADALRRLYRGQWCDYVECKTCGHQSERASAFDDVNLAIRAFDATQTPIRTLEGALAAFLEPETLDGDNAYYCERCTSKQPALKGIRFTALPPVLCIGLKRFDFDFATLGRIKLHHSVAVPLALDADSLLYPGSSAARQPKRKLASDGGDGDGDSGDGGSGTGGGGGDGSGDAGDGAVGDGGTGW